MAKKQVATVSTKFILENENFKKGVREVQQGMTKVGNSATVAGKKVRQSTRDVENLGMNTSRLGPIFQGASQGVEDFASQIQNGMGPALRAAGNNISFTMGMINPMAGALAGLGTAAAAAFLSMREGAEDAAEAMDELADVQERVNEAQEQRERMRQEQQAAEERARQLAEELRQPDAGAAAAAAQRQLDDLFTARDDAVAQRDDLRRETLSRRMAEHQRRVREFARSQDRGGFLNFGLSGNRQAGDAREFSFGNWMRGVGQMLGNMNAIRGPIEDMFRDERAADIRRQARQSRRFIPGEAEANARIDRTLDAIEGNMERLNNEIDRPRIPEEDLQHFDREMDRGIPRGFDVPDPEVLRRELEREIDRAVGRNNQEQAQLDRERNRLLTQIASGRSRNQTEEVNFSAEV